MVSRLDVQRVLGGIWFLDGLLQLKPDMFTPAFTSQLILPMAQGQPLWLAGLVTWGARLIAPHPALYDSGFALIQLLLGALLLLDVGPRWSLAGSVAWAVFVWIFGEALGQVLGGGQLLVSGAPGPGVLYALVSVAIWPVAEDRAAWSAVAARFAQVALGGTWLLGCLLLFLAAPGGLAHGLAVRWAARALAPVAPTATVLLLVTQGFLGLMLVFGRQVTWAARCSILLALLIWWLGEDFGQIWSALGTDVNSGPLLVLLALSAAPGAVGRWVVARLRLPWVHRRLDDHYA